MKILKRIVTTIMSTLLRIKWYLQFRCLICVNKCTRNNAQIISFDKAVLVVPHADDELIGAFQLILNHKSDVILFYSNWIGSEVDTKVRDIRKAEFISLCELLKVKYCISENWKDDFKHFMKKNDIDTIILPSPVDWHPEHRKVNYFVHDCLQGTKEKQTCNLVLYGVTIPIINESVLIQPMNKEQIKQKYRVFTDTYISQHHMPILRLKYQERLNGKAVGLYAGESFLSVSYSEWIHMLDTIKSNENEFINLKYSINNIRKIRSTSKRIYSQFILNQD